MLLRGTRGMWGRLGRFFGQGRDESKLPAPALDQPAPSTSAPAPVAAGRPRLAAFLDVETTGLTDADRVVSIGIITLDMHAAAADGTFHLSLCHLVFDPGRKSHPGAERAHGYDDWTLRHQDAFEEHAGAVRGMIHTADLVVAHNAAFDLSFIDREFILAGLDPIAIPNHCTMLAWRRLGYGDGASLATASRHLGLRRSGVVHGALEDAYLAMRLHLVMERIPASVPFSDLNDVGPTNWREAPPRPQGSLARRRRRSAQAHEGMVGTP